ncbi:reverse transcriptase domain, reverse transcriptase zinc-binding domain protein [Tanacetum coccineum]
MIRLTVRLTVRLPLKTTLRSKKWRPLKLKKVSKRRQKTLPPKEGFKTSPWTIEEEVALCQAWCDMSENNITGNVMKSKGFWLKPCWQILKNHPAWKQVKMPAFYSKRNPGSKKSKTSETTSGSTQGGLNLNEDADGSEEEVQEVRPMGRDRAEKKSSTSSHSETSSAAGGGIVDMVADKWKSFKSIS